MAGSGRCKNVSNSSSHEDVREVTMMMNHKSNKKNK
jgi:hypothetical protein